MEYTVRFFKNHEKISEIRVKTKEDALAACDKIMCENDRYGWEETSKPTSSFIYEYINRFHGANHDEIWNLQVYTAPLFKGHDGHMGTLRLSDFQDDIQERMREELGKILTPVQFANACTTTLYYVYRIVDGVTHDKHGGIKLLHRVLSELGYR